MEQHQISIKLAQPKLPLNVYFANSVVMTSSAVHTRRSLLKELLKKRYSETANTNDVKTQS